MTNSYGELVKSLETKKLIIFGAGRYFSEFSLWYQELLEQTECILDNQYEKEDFLRLGNLEIVTIPPRMAARYDISKYAVLFCSICVDKAIKRVYNKNMNKNVTARKGGFICLHKQKKLR